MKTETNHVTVYVGTEVNIQYLQSIFENAGISSMVKNNYQSGLRAGFYGGLQDQVQLQVQSKRFEEAKKIADDTFPKKR